ncbi:MAG: hypothetical protein RJA36_3830 [Pseudomonadota bacterium]|jgi:hypothetical protein
MVTASSRPPADSSRNRGRERGRFGGTVNGREMPWSADAERHVIACALLDGDDTINRAKREGLTPETFYGSAHRTIWSCILDLHATRPPVTMEMVAEELQTRKLLETVGGVATLLAITAAVPTTAHAGFFIDAVREKHALRQVIEHGTRIVEGAYSYSGGGLDVYEPLLTGVERLEQLKSRARGALPGILRWEEFVPKEQSKLPEEIVAGVLNRGAKMMIAGGSKSFKTWVLLHLGLSVATGTPWWGMKTKPGRVLYVNLELMREYCEVRTRQICAAMKVERAEQFDSWHLRGYACDFTKLLPHFFTMAAGSKYALIILDPVYKILGDRDENANGEVAQLLNDFEALAVRTGAAVAYGHHHSKGNQSEKDARDRSSGAGAWTRDPDALIDLTPHQEDEHFTATFTLRNHAPKAPMVIRWEFPVMSIAPGMDPTALRKPGRPKERGVSDILAILMGRGAGLSYADWRAEAEQKGISASTFKRLREQAVSEKKVEQVAGLYRLPSTGG